MDDRGRAGSPQQHDAARDIRQMKVAGTLYYVLVLGVFWGGAYLLWPGGALDIPIAAVTGGAWLRMIGAGVLALIGALQFLGGVIVPALASRRDRS